MTLRKGQKVRVTFEGVYDGECSNGGSYVKSHCEGPGTRVFDATSHFGPDATIEPIEDLRPGDVYRDADGRVVINSASGFWYFLDGHQRVCCNPPFDPPRPLTLLVRDGKPVQP